MVVQPQRRTPFLSLPIVSEHVTGRRTVLDGSTRLLGTHIASNKPLVAFENYSNQAGSAGCLALAYLVSTVSKRGVCLSF